MRPLRSERDQAESVQAWSAARSAFVATGRVPAGVRPDIARSWQRSRAAGFMSTTADWAPARRQPDSSQLSRAFDQELRARLATLTRLGLAAILVDRDAVVVSYCGFPDGKENLHLVRSDVLPQPGSSMAEGSIGTHAANLALESGGPEQVVAHEHLHERYLGTHSAAVPIVNATTGHTVGALVVERVAPASALLLPWASEVATAVRLRMRQDCSEREMLLMRDFLSARAEGRRPVICLDQQTLLCNAAASRLLASGDQAVLWECGSRFLRGDASDTTVLALSNTGSHIARFEQITGSDGPAGVRITLQACKERKTPARNRSSAASALLDSLPGRSQRWARLVEDLESALSVSDRVVLVGEPGTGKRHIARALVPPAAREIDCSSEADTLELLRRRRSGPRPLVVTHLERLSDAALAVVEQILLSDQHPEAPLVLTLTEDRGEATRLTQRGSGVGPWVRVPALRDRLDDLPQLVAELTANRTKAGQEPLRWMPDALQVLARVDWPENLRSLQSVVDSVAHRCRTGYVDSRQLPEGVRARAAGRRLSRLEQLEAWEVLASLRESDGNKLAAAERLGIARSTLYRRMRSLGLDLASVNY
jgi:sigma-54 dependent transcriptional regulator, acetoin dehydrogenase operon transcriptional activator AcoR